MTQWYYADHQRQQRGPLAGPELAALFRSGTVHMATLVWREGLSGWQPLSAFLGELELDEPAPAPAAFTASPEPATPTTLAHPTGPAPGATVVFGGLWRRFAANIIDSFGTTILICVLLFPLLLALGISLGALARPETGSAGVGIGFVLAYYGISLGVPALYFGWMHSSSLQASLGKLAVGIKVVRTNGDPVGFWRALLRYVAYMLFALLTCGLGVLISGLMVAMTTRKQALHDMICDTLVVDKWAFTDHPERQQRGLGTATIVILVLFGLLLMATTLVAMMIGIIAAQGR